MELPILEKLKDGEKFDFATLADNIEQTDEYWDWWWKEKAQEGVITRPEIIQDEDETLAETVNKSTVDLCSYGELFDRFLLEQSSAGRLPVRDGFPRDQFRDQLLRIVGANSAKLQGRPQVIFAGGGYGSGKTTALNMLAQSGVLPVGCAHMVGVDMFKILIPEFNLIKAVADGRASKTVQKECVELAKRLYLALIAAGRSFIWDSSMSNKAETVERIKLAQASDFEMTMIAVLTPLALATKQAMDRAFDSRRFPHPDALPQSHIGFREAFTEYIQYFDEIKVFARLTGEADASLVAEKVGGAKELVILDKDVFNLALRG